VTIDDTAQSATTDSGGNFTIPDVPAGDYDSVTADADGFLPAVCSSPTMTAPTTDLNPITLLSGDVNADNAVDITDATAVGASFGATGPGLDADINLDEIVDIFDIILVSINFGMNGPQEWACQ